MQSHSSVMGVSPAMDAQCTHQPASKSAVGSQQFATASDRSAAQVAPGQTGFATNVNHVISGDPGGHAINLNVDMRAPHISASGASSASVADLNTGRSGALCQDAPDASAISAALSALQERACDMRIASEAQGRLDGVKCRLDTDLRQACASVALEHSGRFHRAMHDVLETSHEIPAGSLAQVYTSAAAPATLMSSAEEFLRSQKRLLRQQQSAMHEARIEWQRNADALGHLAAGGQRDRLTEMLKQVQLRHRCCHGIL